MLQRNKEKYLNQAGRPPRQRSESRWDVGRGLLGYYLIYQFLGLTPQAMILHLSEVCQQPTDFPFLTSVSP